VSWPQKLKSSPRGSPIGHLQTWPPERALAEGRGGDETALNGEGGPVGSGGARAAGVR
jgi:hypothetical protein